MIWLVVKNGLFSASKREGRGNRNKGKEEALATPTERSQPERPERNKLTRVSRTMSDTGSDYTEQTGMVSELTLEREVRRERPAAQAAAATNALAADPTAAAAAAAPTPPRAAGVTHEYRGGVEESKEIPEEEEEEEEDLVGDEDDEIESSISQRRQQQHGRTSHKSTVDALASPDEQSTTTASSAGTGAGGKSSVQREKIRVAALKARRASSRAVQSVVKYERDHQLVQTTWAGIQRGVRYAGRKVRECTSVDTTATPSGDDGK